VILKCKAILHSWNKPAWSCYIIFFIYSLIWLEFLPICLWGILICSDFVVYNIFLRFWYQGDTGLIECIGQCPLSNVLEKIDRWVFLTCYVKIHQWTYLSLKFSLLWVLTTNSISLLDIGLLRSPISSLVSFGSWCL
jgi:hypothetical protein